MPTNSKLKPQHSKLAPMVLKIGGNDIDSPAFLTALAEHVAGLDVPVVIVHGGGKEIGVLQEKMGIPTQWVDGLRVTDAATLGVVEMVLCGSVNKRLVRQLIAAEVDAQGLSGTDRGVIRATKLHNPHGDLGRVGEVTAVRGDVLLAMLAQGITPVVAPLALGDDGDGFNVNADHAAAAVAKAIGASRIVFLTNVSAVLIKDVPQAAIGADQAEALIEDGTINGGMIPKVRTALHAVAVGVPQAVITNLAGLANGGGTVFHGAGVLPLPQPEPTALQAAI